MAVVAEREGGKPYWKMKPRVERWRWRQRQSELENEREGRKGGKNRRREKGKGGGRELGGDIGDRKLTETKLFRNGGIRRRRPPSLE